MALIGRISIAMGVDTNGLNKGLDRARGRLGEFERSLVSTSSAIKGLFGGLAAGFAAGGATAVLVDLTRSAASLEEGINKLDAVFGKSSERIQKTARDMADGYGISINEIVSDFGRLGSMLNGAGFDESTNAAMSETLVRLANDLSRFNDTSFEVAFQKLRSGLAGESEPLRDFGIFLSEDAVKAKALELGLVGLGGKISDAAKIQARANIIMQAAGPAIGAASREAAGTSAQLEALSGRWENLKVTIGESVAPAIGAALGEINVALKAMADYWNGSAAAGEGWAGRIKSATEGGSDLARVFRLVRNALLDLYQIVDVGLDYAMVSIEHLIAVPLKVGTEMLRGLDRLFGDPGEGAIYKWADAQYERVLRRGNEFNDKLWKQQWAHNRVDSALQAARDGMAKTREELAAAPMVLPQAAGNAAQQAVQKIKDAFKSGGIGAAIEQAVGPNVMNIGRGLATGLAVLRQPSPPKPGPVAWNFLRGEVPKPDLKPTAFARAMRAGSAEAAETIYRNRYSGAKDPVAANTKDAAGSLRTLVRFADKAQSAANTTKPPDPIPTVVV